VVRVALKSESGGSVSGESLEVPDRLTVLGKKAEARVP